MIRWLICLTLAHLTSGSAFHAAEGSYVPEALRAAAMSLLPQELSAAPEARRAPQSAPASATTAEPAAAQEVAAPQTSAPQPGAAAPDPHPRVAKESTARSGHNSRTRTVEVRPSMPVNINTATVEELDGLPGIGAHMAQRIIEYRQKQGPFKRVEDLMGVRGIGEKNFLKLKPLITVSTPKT